MEKGERPTGVELRERRRQRTAAEIEAAAIDLFATHGYDPVSVLDIAIAAGVSERTFFRYFENKEEVLSAGAQRRMDALCTEFEAQDASLPVWRALHNAVVLMFTSLEQEKDSERFAKILDGSPETRAKLLMISRRLSDHRIAEAVARRMNVDSASDIRPLVLTHTMLRAAQLAYERWVSEPERWSLMFLCEEALGLVEAGVVLI